MCIFAARGMRGRSEFLLPGGGSKGGVGRAVNAKSESKLTLIRVFTLDLFIDISLSHSRTLIADLNIPFA